MAPGIAEKKNNLLPIWGNEKTMNLNNLILTNILSSHYFKVNLYQLKTYHEVIDEIYYQVNHLEPWEKGSRKTSGQTGMCGGVRGVGAGGIVSTAFCILYKLFTLKLTRKQVVGLITHADSPYIRALGFMYIRYTQPPGDLYDWYENYLSDPEELDVKAGGGQMMAIGEMLRHYLSKLEWFSTLFPRIPVPIQKDLERKLTIWRSRPENRALIENSIEYNTEAEQQTVEEEFTDNSAGQRNTKNCDTKRKDYAEDVRDSHSKVEHKGSDEDVSRDRDRHRRDRDRPVSSSTSRRHSPERHSRHRDRSRSPWRSKDPKSGEESPQKSRKKYRDHSTEHRSHKSTKERRHSSDSESRYTRDRSSNSSRRHEYSHHSKYHSRDRH